MRGYDAWMTAGPAEPCDWCEEQEAESSGLCAECWDEREAEKDRYEAERPPGHCPMTEGP